ncbi:uncharacterized protein LOC120982966 [Bufo bufo]|uniref:uncharacterized protein LOC120982966 n=1 Tax=Bufo bufo TaxID=8384 RepID=UPI001ABE06CD|nr:uncharacterized protein LOC120982966 [Bufo bufo]
MKSPPPQTGPPNLQDETSADANRPPGQKEQAPGETEKDSGYSDDSSESLSSEDTPPSDVTQAPYTPIYILQNVVLKQPQLVLLQPPPRQRRTSPATYLPILRSYPRIAPRLTPPSPAPLKDTAPNSSSAGEHRRSAPQLLEVSLRSLALLRRTRDTQRSIRELGAHTRLYESALQGEDGGWERLREAMERSGGYRRREKVEGASNTNTASIMSRDDSTHQTGGGDISDDIIRSRE